MRSDERETGDGLQTERTRLAWRRTTLAATVVALLAFGRVVAEGARTLPVVGLALVAMAWIAVVAVAHQRIRALTGRSTSDGRPRGRDPYPERPAATVPGDHLTARRAPAALALLTAALALVGTLLLD